MADSDIIVSFSFLWAHTTCLVSLISTVIGRSKKIPFKEAALVAGTQQNLSNLDLNRYLWSNDSLRYDSAIITTNLVTLLVILKSDLDV